MAFSNTVPVSPCGRIGLKIVVIILLRAAGGFLSGCLLNILEENTLIAFFLVGAIAHPIGAGAVEMGVWRELYQQAPVL